MITFLLKAIKQRDIQIVSSPTKHLSGKVLHISRQMFGLGLAVKIGVMSRR